MARFNQFKSLSKSSQCTILANFFNRFKALQKLLKTGFYLIEVTPPKSNKRKYILGIK